MKRNKKLIRIVSVLSAFLITILSCSAVAAFAAEENSAPASDRTFYSHFYAYVRSDDWQETFTPEFFDASLVEKADTLKLIRSEEKGNYLKVLLSLREPSRDNFKALKSSLLENKRVIGTEEYQFYWATPITTDERHTVSAGCTVFNLKKANEEYKARITRESADLEPSDLLATGDMYFDGDLSYYYIIVTGDTDRNGKISSSDARTVLRYAAKLDKFNEVSALAADVNADGKINSSDARIILRSAAKLDKIDGK